MSDYIKWCLKNQFGLDYAKPRNLDKDEEFRGRDALQRGLDLPKFCSQSFYYGYRSEQALMAKAEKESLKEAMDELGSVFQKWFASKPKQDVDKFFRDAWEDALNASDS